MYIINEAMDELEMYYTRQYGLIAAGKREIIVRDGQGFVEGYIYK